MKTVAIMQPYFFPYAGYYRLAAMADEFVIFDCVQFPRRGRVHRCQLTGASGKLEWCTLPIAKHPRETPIRDIHWASEACATLHQRLDRFPWLRHRDTETQRLVAEVLRHPLDDLTSYLESTLRMTFRLLGLAPRILRSSELEIDPAIRGQNRILAIAKVLEATDYLNAPGGVSLYSQKDFADRGLKLRFLTPYDGPYHSMLEALFQFPISTLREHLRATCALEVDAGR